MPQALREAGPEGRRKALDEARTQHRQKTTDELGGLADAVVEKIGKGQEDVGLERVREEAGYDEREILQTNIKGLGQTGLDIFFRRVQGLWEEAYRFVDPRTGDALDKLGLPAGANDLRKLVDKQWNELDIEDISGKDDEDKKRSAFV